MVWSWIHHQRLDERPVDHETVTAMAVYAVIYQADDPPNRIVHQRSFWVVITTGTILGQRDATIVRV